MPDYPLLLSCALLGTFAGFMGGMLGIGGGVIIVPSLVLLFDMRHLIPVDHITSTATATSLVTIVFTSIAAARAQMRRRAVRWDIARSLAPWLVVGCITAGFIAPWIPGHAARLFIGTFLGCVALIMLTSWAPAPHRQLPGGAGNAVIAAAAGFVSVVTGIGGGNVVVPTLVYFNVAMVNASATASALGVLVALSGSMVLMYSGRGAAGMPEWSLGYVYLPVAVTIVVTSVLTTGLGVAVAHRVSAPQLKRVFGVFLALAAARMLYSALH